MIALAVALLAAPPVGLRDVVVRDVPKSPDRSLSFVDDDGLHEVAFQVRPAPKKDLGGATLHVVHTQRATSKARPVVVWEAKDFVADCEFDVTLRLLPGSIAVTDLDGDGRGEIAFAYVLSCKSDVSPDAMKLLMYEGKDKYALRGASRVQIGVDERAKPTFEGGTYEVDRAFDAAPPSFLAHARARWDTLVNVSAE